MALVSTATKTAPRGRVGAAHSGDETGEGSSSGRDHGHVRRLGRQAGGDRQTGHVRRSPRTRRGRRVDLDFRLPPRLRRRKTIGRPTKNIASPSRKRSSLRTSGSSATTSRRRRRHSVRRSRNPSFTRTRAIPRSSRSSRRSRSPIRSITRPSKIASRFRFSAVRTFSRTPRPRGPSRSPTVCTIGSLTSAPCRCNCRSAKISCA